jgi:hypothetical protein
MNQRNLDDALLNVIGRMDGMQRQLMREGCDHDKAVMVPVLDNLKDVLAPFIKLDEGDRLARVKRAYRF